MKCYQHNFLPFSTFFPRNMKGVYFLFILLQLSTLCDKTHAGPLMDESEGRTVREFSRWMPPVGSRNPSNIPGFGTGKKDELHDHLSMLHVGRRNFNGYPGNEV